MRKMPQVRALTTDLDGTFIPLSNDTQSNTALEQIRGQLSHTGLPLVFVTGRHLSFVLEGIEQHGLPNPDWILCDVGTSVYERFGKTYRRSEVFDDRLDKIIGETDIEALRTALAELPGFRLQEPVKQGRHKLSYYVETEQLDECHAAAESYLREHRQPYSVISSRDPFNGDGLVDVLPRNVSKAFALDWWCHARGFRNDEILFCGDSGNDYAALIAGYRTVLVGNADRKLAARVYQAHCDQGWRDRLLLASNPSTAGVLEGMHWFGLMQRDVNTNGNSALVWGAIPTGYRQTHFTVFAPAHQTVTLDIFYHYPTGDETRQVEMHRDKAGFFTAGVDDCPVGTNYRFRLGSPSTNSDENQPSVSDPASRFQPAGVHGPSQVVSRQFPWQHDEAPRCQHREELIIYELHLGAFTERGTFLSAIERLDELVELGVTAIELMPIAQCPGRWNWGYDATHWFAPMNSLGTPDDLRQFVDEAHARGLHVFLDVVYNHFGPEGNYWGQLGDYFSTRHHTPWGSSPNFDDGLSATAIRRFVIDNAIYWLDEFHLDGLRVDAIHCMRDFSDEHITRQFGREVRQWSERAGRRIWLIAETNVYDGSMTAPLAEAGCGFDAQWGDDFAHAMLACVRPRDRLTVRSYQPHVDLARALHRGYVFRGDVGGDRGREEIVAGTSQRVDTSSAVYCIQNHDFIGNHPLGQRFHQITSLDSQAAAVAILILTPAIPMLFMGEEFACEKPFAFFVDFGDESLRQAVIAGRRRDYPQHDWSDGVLPTDAAAFYSARIGSAADGNAAMRAWYCDLIALRQQCTKTGLLAGQNLRVTCDQERGCYALEYRQGAASLVVISRLTEHAVDIRPQSDGMSLVELAEMLKIKTQLPPLALDSRAAIHGNSESPFQLHANQAAIFTSSKNQR
jgi:alpha-amylase